MSYKTRTVSWSQRLLYACMVSVIIASIAFLVNGLIHLWVDYEQPFHARQFWLWQQLNFEQSMLLLVLFGGALGAIIHIAWSFSIRVGRQEFENQWITWYILRPFVGAVMAFAFYLFLRGIVVMPVGPGFGQDAMSKELTDNIVELTTQLAEYGESQAALQLLKMYVDQKNGYTMSIDALGDETLLLSGGRSSIPPLNPYGILAIAVFAGLFAKQAIDKMEGVFGALLKNNKKELKGDFYFADQGVEKVGTLGTPKARDNGKHESEDIYTRTVGLPGDSGINNVSENSTTQSSDNKGFF